MVEKEKTLMDDVRTISGKDNKGNDVSVDVLRPTAAHLREAQMSYNRAFRDALESGALLRQKLDQYMLEQKIWDEEKENRYQEINKELLAYEKKIKEGGIKLLEAKSLAIDMKNKREEFRELIGERTAMDGNTAEGQADNARFNSLVIQCLVEGERGHGSKSAKNPIFSSLEDYDKKAAEPYLVDAASELAQMMYNLDPKYDHNLPENKFLRDYKFADKKNRLIDDDGHLIDEEGRLINDEGRFIDKKGEYIDIEGNKLDKEGDYVVDQKPFLDDKGSPLPLPKTGEKNETETTEDEVEEESEVEAESEVTVKTKDKTVAEETKDVV